TELGRFDLFLPPTGRVFIPGPNVEKVPNKVDGMYKILLRIEATSDKEGNSNTLAGVARSGGVAGFPMPMLRYYVGEHNNIQGSEHLEKIQLLLPVQYARLNTTNSVNFSWADIHGAALYRLEIDSRHEVLFSALVNPGVENYSVPYFVMEGVAENARWRVKALSAQGSIMAKSPWRRFESK
ncbi:MAG: hypothetical protein R8K20_11100, partial [Gallionellaceae bacterium]